MCKQCTAESISYGEVIPGWILVRARKDADEWKAGQWGLVWENDPSFTWSSDPTPDPLFRMPEAQWDAWFEANRDTPAAIRAMESAPDDFEAAFQCAPDIGYGLVTAGMQRGYDPEKSGDFTGWLFSLMGEHLDNATPTDNDGNPVDPTGVP